MCKKVKMVNKMVKKNIWQKNTGLLKKSKVEKIIKIKKIEQKKFIEKNKKHNIYCLVWKNNTISCVKFVFKFF